MKVFFDENVNFDNPALPESEAFHAIKVLRVKKDEEILILDGKGTQIHAIVTEITKKACFYEITSKKSKPGKDFEIHLMIAPTKSIERIEWLVEKLTEIGVDKISFIQTANSERTKIRLDRLEKKVVSALKQSKNAFKPELFEMDTLQNVIQADKNPSKFVAYVQDGLDSLKSSVKPKESTTLLIGPEGDFTESEIQFLLDEQYKAVSLGENTLRTETAGLIACQTIHFCNS